MVGLVATTFRTERFSPPFVDDFAPCLFLFDEAWFDPDTITFVPNHLY